MINKQTYSLWQLLRYFLWLGSFGFGGPIALAGHIQRDLVEQKKWISQQDYLQGFAFAQLCPGPLATQLAMYLGWIHSGILGATLVGITFVLPSLIIVIILAALYIQFGNLPWIQGVVYGMGASVIAIIIRSALKIGKMVVGKEALLWIVLLINAAMVLWTGVEIVWIFISSGLLVLLVKSPLFKKKPQLYALTLSPKLFVTGLHGPTSLIGLLKILAYFSWAGAFVFGSGLAIVPFLHGGVVDQFHWLNERQFIDAVAVALITPGPAVITVAFIGYLAAGMAGALLAGIGVFMPCYLLVIIFARYFQRFGQHPYVQTFVQGVTAAAAGAMFGAAYILGRHAITDFKTFSIFLITLGMLFFARKIPEPVLVIAAGIAGLMLH